jgi:hypothetical protein
LEEIVNLTSVCGMPIKKRSLIHAMFGSNVRKRRLRQGLTQEEFAQSWLAFIEPTWPTLNEASETPL